MTKKKLPVRFTGQHFTIDKVLIKDAIRQANISNQDTVLDIGAGKGFLTVHLLKIANNVVAIENDTALVEHLRKLFSDARNVQVVGCDFRNFAVPKLESYTAAKGGIAALTHALAVTLRGKARVNSISPGWIDTDFKEYDGADAVQQPAGRVGNPMDIANMVLYLCSDKAGFITGENICIDGGMTRQMIYHGDYGWMLTE